MPLMTRFFRFSPSRLAIGHVALSVLVLALFAIPLWYAWSVNISTFRAYVHGEDVDEMMGVFERAGVPGLAAAIEAKVGTVPGDEIIALADASNARIAGNLPWWPPEVPDAAGTYGLAIGIGDDVSMRVVAVHTILPGGYRLLMGRESARFQSLVELFWYGIAAATAIVVVLGVVIGWLIRRALLADVQEISRTAAAIVEGDLSRRLDTRSASDELSTLARTVNGMLEQLARQNVRLEGEIAVRRQAEEALHRAHHELEDVVRQRTLELASANVSLRRSEAFLAEGQRISHTGSWGWVLSSGKITWSEEQYRMLGFDPGEGVPSIDLFLRAIHPDDRTLVRQGLEQAMRARQPYAMDYRVILPDGAIRHLRSVGRPVVTESCEVDEYIGVTTDITERVQSEAALKQSEQRLRQAQRLEAMGTLAGGIAHDFNNILGAILGYGEMAQRDARPGSRLRSDLDSIVSAGERGRALVDRILTFSRSGVSERIPVQVEQVVREALDLLTPTLPRNVTIETHLNAGRAAMLGDPTQVHQVLMNLATNAIHAMSGGGTLRVSLDAVRIDRPRTATIGAISAADYLVLEVADSGNGITPEVLERIFDPFFTTKEVSVGTGLGLSLVHGIVTEVGGAIDVVSAAGRGSVFTVYLPRTGEAQEVSSGSEAAMPRGNGESILVVDDEASLARLVTETLLELGYRPVAFTSSAAALEVFRADPSRFDAVITDERMPGMTGSSLIRELRGARRDIPILLVSGYLGGMVAGRAYNAGADEVLKKPLSARELATSLARVLELQSSRVG